MTEYPLPESEEPTLEELLESDECNLKKGSK
jgi:hypothetical protein